MIESLSDNWEEGRGLMDKPLWLNLLLLSLVWVVIGTLFALQIVWLDHVPVRMAFLFALMDWGPWILLSPLVLWLGSRVHVSSSSWKWALPVHLLMSVLIAILMESGARFFFRPDHYEGAPMPPPQEAGPFPGPGQTPAEGRVTPPPEFRQPPDPEPMQDEGPAMGMIRVRINIPIYWLLIVSMHALAYHRHSLERERRALKAEALLAEAQLAALQAQINPHFLFNTLNTVVLYIHEDPKTAEAMVESLSGMLRTVLAASRRREVSLTEEIAFVEGYLAIQQVRFADRLQIRYELDETAMDATVPTLFLQPLVENAVIHGVSPSKNPGTIYIRARRQGDKLCIQVADTGHGAHASLPAGSPISAREGIGLSNTRARLKALFGEEFNFTLTTALEGGACAQVDLPFVRHQAPVEQRD